MEFKVLGALEVSREGTAVPLGAGKLRALLAVLLFHANEPVSGDRLASALWGDEVPLGAIRTVRVYVSRLRKALGDDDRLITSPAGYRLDVHSGELDAERFERLLERGRRALAAGRSEESSDLLREALQLWRGPALADLAFERFAQAEITRLEELRLAAVELRVDADLAAARHAELVGELQRLASEHPLRERLHGQLMVALYRCGRQGDALRAYQHARELLVDQLGIEPGPELRALERAVLTHDPSLAISPREPVSINELPSGVARPPSPSAAGPAPSQRRPPALLTPFLGRVREVSDLTTMLASDDIRLLTLTGAGGSGKTRLALRVAEAIGHRYRDGWSFVDFAEVSDPDLITVTICQTLGITKPLGMEATERLAHWLGNRPMLLLLDNLEQLAEGTEVLGRLLAACPRLVLLVTSREPLHLTGEHQYDVPVLANADAVELFIERSQTVAPRLTVDRALIAKICHRLDFLPLAIELAAARTKALSPRQILARLDRRLPLLRGGPRNAPQRQRTLEATIDWSHDLLTNKERRMFARIAVFSGGCTAATAQAVCDADVDTLQALVDRSLLRCDGERYWMLQTLREYALDRLDQTGEADDIRRRHHQYFADMLDAEAPTTSDLYSGKLSQRMQSTAMIEERENIMSALKWALGHREWRGWRQR